MSQPGADPEAEEEKIVFKFNDGLVARVSDGKTHPEQQSANAPFDGTIIDGRYKLHELIGAGAMAVVYRGEHIATERPVAIKILSEAGDDESHARFKQEANAILAISHPHIVAAYDFGLLPSGESFLVMDLVEGTTVEKLIDAKTLINTSEIVNIAEQVASGLGEAHRCGVLHRDVKPSNIMLVGAPGSFFVKIVDFGLAKPVSGASELRLTKTGQVVGTPLYMSPEQCAGMDMDARSDLYSFGCVLYELVTGEPPFLAENALRVLHMHINDRPRPLREFTGASQNAALEAIILKLLEKDRTRRFQTASELIVALERSQQKMGFFAKTWAASTFRTGPPKLLWLSPILILALLGFFTFQYFAPHKVVNQSPTSVPTQREGDEVDSVLSHWNTLVEKEAQKAGWFSLQGNNPHSRLFLFPDFDLGQIRRWPPLPGDSRISARGRVAIDIPFEFKPLESTCEYAQLFKRFRSDEIAKLDASAAGDYADSVAFNCILLQSIISYNAARSSLSPVGFRQLEMLRNLQDLDVSGSSLAAEALAKYPRLKQLNALCASSVEGDMAAVIAELKGSKKITRLHVGYDRLSDKDMTNVASLANLTTLQLTGNDGVTDAGLKQLLSHLKHLQSLEIDGCSIHPAPSNFNLLRSLSQLYELKVDRADYLLWRHGLPESIHVSVPKV